MKNNNYKNKYSIDIDKTSIDWSLEEGTFNFFNIKSALFWIKPSLSTMLYPLAREVGIDLYRLMIAHSASKGTEEDYNFIVTKLGNNFSEGFTAWGDIVSAAGWGRFELLEFDLEKKHAVIKVRNTWELLLQEDDDDTFGCPFIQGKLIGIFSRAFGGNCWADEIEIKYSGADKYVKFKIYESRKTIKEELSFLRLKRKEKKEIELENIVHEKTLELQEARKALEDYSKKLELKVEKRTEELKLKNEKLEDALGNFEKANREIVRLSALKGKIFTILSHDLRGLFTSVLGFSDMLVHEYDDLSQKEIKNFNMRIFNSVKNVYGLLDNMLEWSKLQINQSEVSPEVIEIRSLIKATIEIYKAEAEKKNIEFDVVCGNKLIALADLNMVGTILRNLISNAIKYSFENGYVKISAIRENGQIKIDVSDNGVGISEMSLQKIFNMDEYISTKGTNNEKGNGLGLKICKEFVEMNQGSLFIKSEEKKGSVFSFTLPAG